MRTLIALGPIALFAAGCGLVPISVNGEGTVNTMVRTTGSSTTYEENVIYDPSDNEDYNKYKDQIADGSIDSITITITRIESSNQATVVAGQVDLRREGASDDAWIKGVSRWEGLPVVSGNSVVLYPVEFENYDALNDLVFRGEPGPLEIRIQGVADAAPVSFDLEVTIQFTASN